MKKRTVFISSMATLVTLAIILTSACGPSAPGTTVTTDKPSGAQVITLNLGGEVNTIDPNRASWSNERSVIMQVFDGLLAFNQDLSLKPMVASDIPTAANTGI